ncbi:S-methyl-5-thioribose-1-phosphate isomerase [Mahella australiensis]|uniref:Methylthioribose-1-phosphate isomerase n=1 Tax=Mahella australiensis (strain DSM 15567 / CIP 107919 / 50-1 BON) TaxID=697281 RepID=F4A1C9_MAHA5|nr:S-methyl-5-thioribose-1-phosphate isomerase [Mahella australiensis]AEE97048.1 methylthioribose-1-phosphate isomerase [Mahella australiensis 50-1 BON]
MTNTLEWTGSSLKLIDQTVLPLKERIIECRSYEDVADAIKTMKVRGAPAIGVTAAYGMVLGAMGIETADASAFMQRLNYIADVIKSTRPTAVNLFWAVDKILTVAQQASKTSSVEIIKEAMQREADQMAKDDIEANKAMGEFGQVLLNDGDSVLTHCNAGALATVGYGTALGVIRAAVAHGKKISVYADETRPFLQGARLTAWELARDGIDVTVIADNMAGYLMRNGKIDKVIVGADRIAVNGDTANKIGTYSVAVLAHHHQIPFYVAAPVSTIDKTLPDGSYIPIEQRDPKEMIYVNGVQIMPDDVKVINPAFDVTPHDYISAIITEKGILYPPYNIMNIDA